jgi:Fic family protein
MYDPAFIISTELLNSIGQIESAKAVIDNSPLLPLYERQFKAEATVRKVHFSTAIEGNYLELSEVKRIVDMPEGSVPYKKSEMLHTFTDAHGNQLIARQRDLFEVINYREVVKHVEKIIENKKKGKYFELAETEIFKMHKLLLKNIRNDILGKYREGIAVTINYATGEKLYPYEDVGNFKVKMRELIEWYNSERTQKVHPVIKAGLLHLEFVRIHPFEEGNGRMARALATLSLSLDGYDINHFFCLDEYYDSNAQDYYDALGAGFKNPSLWLEYFALGIAIEFGRIKERVQKISKDAKIKEKSGQIYITERQEQIIEWINNYGYFQNKDFDELFSDLSEDTVLRELKGLVDADIITKKGKTKSARYELV